jgi:hypothetical protein
MMTSASRVRAFTSTPVTLAAPKRATVAKAVAAGDDGEACALLKHLVASITWLAVPVSDRVLPTQPCEQAATRELAAGLLVCPHSATSVQYTFKT